MFLGFGSMTGGEDAPGSKGAEDATGSEGAAPADTAVSGPDTASASSTADVRMNRGTFMAQSPPVGLLRSPSTKAARPPEPQIYGWPGQSRPGTAGRD